MYVISIDVHVKSTASPEVHLTCNNIDFRHCWKNYPKRPKTTEQVSFKQPQIAPFITIHHHQACLIMQTDLCGHAAQNYLPDKSVARFLDINDCSMSVGLICGRARCLRWQRILQSSLLWSAVAVRATVDQPWFDHGRLCVVPTWCQKVNRCL